MKKKAKKKVKRKVKRKTKGKVIRKKKAKVVKAKKKKVLPRKEKQAASKAKSKTSIPPGASLEEIGAVTHYFPRVEAAVVKLTKGSLSLGDTIIIKGHTTDFKEKVDSIQLDHVPVDAAAVGKEVGLRVKSKVRDHDVVYKIVG